MIVTCQLQRCPYNNNGFCAKATVVSIDQSGMCKTVWRKGRPAAIQPSFKYPKEEVNIVDVMENEIYAVDSEVENEIQEDANK